MHTDYLHAFVAVMQTGSISGAAAQLYLTQPAISKRIRNLEQQLGTRLFEPLGRTIHPTPSAQQLLPLAERWLNDFEHLKNQLTQPQGISGHLTIGTSHHIGLHHLRVALTHFVKKYPDVALDVRFVDSEQAHEAVLAAQIDVAFLTLPPQRDSRLHYHALWTDPLRLMCAPFHPLAHKQPLQLVDLIEYPALLPAPNTYTTQITLKTFAEHGLRPSASMTTNPLESIRMLVSIGLGWSVLPQTLLNEHLHLLEIDQLHLDRKLGMVWHPQRTQSRAMQELISLFRHPAI